MRIDVKPYDEATDSIEIEGTKYSGQLFRELGCAFPQMVGQVLRIDRKENGFVTVTRLMPNASVQSSQLEAGNNEATI